MHPRERPDRRLRVREFGERAEGGRQQTPGAEAASGMEHVGAFGDGLRLGVELRRVARSVAPGARSGASWHAATVRGRFSPHAGSTASNIAFPGGAVSPADLRPRLPLRRNLPPHACT